MKPEHIGQSLLAVVIGLAGYKYFTSNSEPAASSIPAPAYVASVNPPTEPTTQAPPATQTGASKFICFAASLNNGEGLSECHATAAECQERAKKAKSAIGDQGKLFDCEANDVAYVFAIKDGPIETAVMLAQRTMADCEWRRKIELKKAKPDDVSPCMAFASPDELKD